MIYKMFDGRHIDLSKIYAVGPVQDRDYFEVWFQLADIPIRFNRRWDGKVVWAAHGAYEEAYKAGLRSGASDEASKQRGALAFDGIYRPYVDEVDEEFAAGRDALVASWKEYEASRVQQN